MLNPTNDQDETSVLILSTSPGIILPDNSNTTTTNTTQEMKKPDEVQPAVIPQAPIPIDTNNRLKTNEWSTRTKTIFVKNLKKSQKLGCDVFRKPPKRIICKRFQPIIKEVDDLMKEEIDRKAKGQLTWNQLSILVYAGAMTVDMLVGRSSEEKQSRSKLWFKSTYREVDNLRKTIGKATAELGRTRVNAKVAPMVRQRNNIRLLEKKYHCRIFVEITSLVEKLTCRLQLLLSRIELRKADERRAFVRRSPPKMIFRDKGTEDPSNSTDVHQIRRYWKGIVGVKKNFQGNNPMLVAWRQSLPEQPEVDNLRECLNLDLWQRVVRRLKPWKASGPDGLEGFWWKTFSTANTSLYKLVHHHLTSGAPLPQGWIANGRVILLHKSGPRSDPSNFRPIACLNTCYKLLTGFISAYLKRYMSDRNLLACEQGALQKNVWGCTHAFILDQTLVADAHDQKQRPISVGWIDYAKAFDSVPHSYIHWLFKAMQVPFPLRTFLKNLMNGWKVKYEVKAQRGQVNRSNSLRIRAGVLQGDSFSPLLFCLAMVPISHALNNSGYCYKTASGKLNNLQLSLSHQFYMDDLKLYADSEQSLTELLRIVQAISLAINMKINSKKCAVAHFVPKRMGKEEVVTQKKNDGGIQLLDGGLHYKYLGIDQELYSNELITWDRVVDNCLQKSRRLWSSELTFRQEVNVHNSTIVPALTYVSSNTIKGSGKYETQLFKGEQFDKKIRRLLIEEKARYKANARSRLYLTSEKGGCNLKSVRDAIEETTIYTWAYLCTRADLKPSLSLFEKMVNRGKRSVISDARSVLRSYNIDAETDMTASTVAIDGVQFVKATNLAQHVVGLIRNVNNTRRFEEWKNLDLAGRVLHSAQDIDLNAVRIVIYMYII